jgi:salicylate hydroxylase
MNMVAVRAKADGKWEHEEWVVESTREAMLESFEGWDPKIIALLHCVEKTDMWGLFDHGKAPKYYNGRICMMGDAAHASTPHQGQGAGMAFEDAYILSQLIGHARTADDLEGSFRAFDAVRRPRTQRLVETSREAGRIWAFREAGIGDDIEKVKRAAQGRQNWLWFEDLEGEIKEGKAMMAES